MGEGGESAGVLAPGIDVMDRAWADDQQKAAVMGEDEPVNLVAGTGDKIGLCLGLGERSQHLGWRGERPGLHDIDVGGLMHKNR